MSSKILVADDEPAIRESLGYALRREGFEVTEVEDGDEALAEGRAGGYDLVILDVMMPAQSGLDVCRSLRAESDVPIVMLTAKDAEIDRVLGLELGADDYVTKPFSIAEPDQSDPCAPAQTRARSLLGAVARQDDRVAEDRPLAPW